MATSKALESRDQYTVRWIAALSLELAAATAMLDEEHKKPLDYQPACVNLACQSVSGQPRKLVNITDAVPNCAPKIQKLSKGCSLPFDVAILPQLDCQASDIVTLHPSTIA
jgi:hypothetical protein